MSGTSDFNIRAEAKLRRPACAVRAACTMVPHSGVHWAKEGHGDDNSDASLSGSDSSNMI